MAKKRLFRQIVIPYLVIVLAAVAAVSWYASYALRRFYFDQMAGSLESYAQMAGYQAGALVSKSNYAEINKLCRELSAKTTTRFTLILPSGEVVGDSDEDPVAMDNHSDRAEIIEALRGQTGMSTRYSNTLRRNMMYVACPIRSGGRVVAVMRAALAVTALEETLARNMVGIAAGGFITAVFAGFLSFVISRRISRPLREMKRAAERFAQGDLNIRVPVENSEELGGLAMSLNWMAAQLDEQLHTIQRQKKQQEAMLSSMIEGVLAVDADENLIDMNRAAADLLRVDAENVRGRSIQEVIRNIDIQQFVRKTLTSHEPVEADIVIQGSAPRFLQAHGTVLQDADDRGIGALVVLHDVTKLRQLENIRRDFVANVSHEIKTPITSIKGFVETLLDGAMDDREARGRFLHIVAKQSDRLTAIVEDLLSLSRIEQKSERDQTVLEKNNIRGALEAAIQACEVKAEEKNIDIKLVCKPGIEALLNADLFERAIINLLDNGIKYSEPGTHMRVEVLKSNRDAVISVCDQGCGIPAEHLPRLFERFYRVDKARSRKVGGTGLGLAIVKHIAQAHHGKITVESKTGKGSTFTLYIPLA